MHAGGKIHLKATESDRLSLCRIWPGNWALVSDLGDQESDKVCKMCVYHAQAAAKSGRLK
jgi:hypothetical protein